LANNSPRSTPIVVSTSFQGINAFLTLPICLRKED
jgi:hypothetical protein